MKNPIHFTGILIGIALIFLTSACKKDDHSVACRISGINDSDSVRGTRLYYNANGSLTSIVYDQYIKTTFAYSANKIFAATTGDLDTLYQLIEVTLDNSGRMISAVRKDGAERIIKTYAFEYNNSGQLANYTVEDYGGGSPRTIKAVFTNGDITSLLENSWVLKTFEYFTDQPDQDASPLRLQQQNDYGAFFYHNTHLLKATKNSDGVTTAAYEYEFDNTGKIVKVLGTYNGSFKTTDTYRYTCN